MLPDYFVNRGMRIAVFLEDFNFRDFDKEARRLFLFEVKDETVTAVGEKKVNFRNMNYLILWLLARAVKIIYADNFPESGRGILTKAGVIFHPLANIREHPYIQALLMKEEHTGE